MFREARFAGPLGNEAIGELLVQQVGVIEGRSEQFAPTAGRVSANGEVVVSLIADRVVDVTSFAAAA